MEQHNENIEYVVDVVDEDGWANSYICWARTRLDAEDVARDMHPEATLIVATHALTLRYMELTGIRKEA